MVLAAPVDERATFFGSLLVRVTKVNVEAGRDSDTGKAAIAYPGWTMVFTGKMMPLTTDTSALALEIAGDVVLAVMVAGPGATPVTGTSTLVSFAGKIMVAGTVAAERLEDVNFTVKLDGAAADKLNVKLRTEPATTEVVPGGKLNAAPTVTVGFAGTGK